MTQYGGGTSEATAIVSGVVAIMKDCAALETTAKDIKTVLLATADKYEHLKEYITEGRVLNAKKAIDTICFQQFYMK